MSYKKKGLKKPVHNKKKMKKAKITLVSKKPLVQGKDTFSSFKDIIMDKPRILSEIHIRIEKAIRIFESYDRIQILGGLGLILLDNLPTIDKVFDAQMSGNGSIKLDDKAEVVMEYAMNFGTALPASSEIAPRKEVIDGLYETLVQLSYLYNLS